MCVWSQRNDSGRLIISVICLIHWDFVWNWSFDFLLCKQCNYATNVYSNFAAFSSPQREKHFCVIPFPSFVFWLDFFHSLYLCFFLLLLCFLPFFIFYLLFYHDLFSSFSFCNICFLFVVFITIGIISNITFIIMVSSIILC